MSKWKAFEVACGIGYCVRVYVVNWRKPTTYKAAEQKLIPSHENKGLLVKWNEERLLLWVAERG